MDEGSQSSSKLCYLLCTYYSIVIIQSPIPDHYQLRYAFSPILCTLNSYQQHLLNNHAPSTTVYRALPEILHCNTAESGGQETKVSSLSILLDVATPH